MSLPYSCDVLVVGSGNAGFSAATAAAQMGVNHVVLIDKCDQSWAGGNTYFTAGAYRTAHNGLQDLLPLVNNVDSTTADSIDLEPYTEEEFAYDMLRVCAGRANPSLSGILVSESNAAVKWLASIGIRFQLSFNRQSYKVDGRHRFFGGLHLKTQDGGKGLVEDHKAAAIHHGVKIYWSTALIGLGVDEKTNRVTSAVLSHQGRRCEIFTGAVILAAGGFESNPQMRAQFLGPDWDVAKVRGTPNNNGDGLKIAIRDAQAQPAGNWSGCHSVAWDANAEANAGDRIASNEYTKSGYPLGIMVNVNGDRFVDEGIDLRNYTYAKFGRAILAQPNNIALQIWDARTLPWLRSEEYREQRAERITASSIQELAELCEQRGSLRNSNNLIRTVTEYNEAVYAHRKGHPNLVWNPAIKDGLSTQSQGLKLPLPKTNWALPLDQAPFVAVKVTCGITFTFGGLKVDPDTSQVINRVTAEGIPGLYCAGEMLGELFYYNYPGGSGLTSGTVFGIRAARSVARELTERGRVWEARL